MTSPKLVVTVLTVVALVGATPTAATATGRLGDGGIWSPPAPDQVGCSDFSCGITSNHNEILTTTRS